MLLWILVIIGVITLDQVSKLLALAFLRGGDSVVIINKILRLTYVENRGAAFGMLDDKRWIFMILSTIGIAAMAVFLFKFAKCSKLLSVSLSFVIGGGIGNMIDRIFLGYVIDMIDCRFIDFYVFNFADSCVCVGAGMVALGFILSAIKEYKKKKAKAEMTDTVGDSHDK